MENTSGSILVGLVEEQSLLVMGSELSEKKDKNLFRKDIPFLGGNAKHGPIYTSANIANSVGESLSVFIAEEKIITKRFLGLFPRQVSSYTVHALFIHGKKTVYAFVYGKEHYLTVLFITQQFAKKAGKPFKVILEMDENPGFNYFLRIINKGYQQATSEGRLFVTTPDWFRIPEIRRQILDFPGSLVDQEIEEYQKRKISSTQQPSTKFKRRASGSNRREEKDDDDLF